MSSLIKSLQRTARAAPTEAVEVPRDFLGFCAWVDVALTDGQFECARVAFDGGSPVGSALGASLFGGVTEVPVGARNVVVLVCGARGGKSYVFVALRLVFGMLVRDLSSMAPGQRAVALIVAPNDKLRTEVFNYALGAVRSKAELAAMLVEQRADEFVLRRPDGQLVTFETGVATRGGYGARGRALTDFALDESAFFRDASYKVNDVEIFRAGTARVLPGGQTIVASTPWAQAGLLYEMHRDNFGKPQDALVAHAPTLVLHDSEMTRAIVARERRRDPENARREFDAEFMTSGTTVFFESTTIDAMLTEEVFVPHGGDSVSAGGDFGFRSDSSSLMLCALRERVMHIYAGCEQRPEPNKPLKPSRTVAAFADVIAGRCSYLMADGHYREAIAEHLETHDLSFAPAPTQPAETYVRARMLLREIGRVVVHTKNLPEGMAQRLVQQLREVQGKPTSGGGMSIVHPRWSQGGHGDLAAAFVLALWQASGEAVDDEAPQLGTREYSEMLADKRRERHREKQEGPRGPDRGAGAWWKRR
jgi:hypothetical protein